MNPSREDYISAIRYFYGNCYQGELGLFAIKKAFTLVGLLKKMLEIYVTCVVIGFIGLLIFLHVDLYSAFIVPVWYLATTGFIPILIIAGIWENIQGSKSVYFTMFELDEMLVKMKEMQFLN